MTTLQDLNTFLPLDNTFGKTVRAEALVSGKKKEALIQCALEACRILDRYGVLRRANHETKKRRIHNWEEEDYYASDEDNFLDRTGTIEKKREQRMKMAGKLETKVETYGSLLENYSNVVEKIRTLESLMASQTSRQKEVSNQSEDTLDKFMSMLDTSICDETQTKKIKIDLLNLRKEESQLLKLMNVAKPINLSSSNPLSIAPKNAKDSLNSVALPEDVDILRLSHCQELDSVCKLGNSSKNLNLITENTKSKNFQENKNKNLIHETLKDVQDKIVHNTDKKLIKNTVRKNNTAQYQQALKGIAKNVDRRSIEDDFIEDYNVWVPPLNQTGDGKTILNEKFGY
ncbi:kanadaptin-like [Copidosoma floridanum]|uniref:kanadaptin-like n=1 Tax=Copidosoma floridanum TaxID=29053 RepID=UPI000C6F4736|nr:kanadaptin-like [Copidosoma floridanum]